MSREGEKIPIPSRVGSNQWSDSACRNLQKRSKKFHRHCEEKGVREGEREGGEAGQLPVLMMVQQLPVPISRYQ
jgi:hypothetical protein